MYLNEKVKNQNSKENKRRYTDSSNRDLAHLEYPLNRNHLLLSFSEACQKAS